MKRAVALLGPLFVGAICVTSTATADDADVIETRQRIMNTLDAQSAIVGQIASGVAPDTNLTVHLEIIALTASTALKSFEPKVIGGGARPKIWSDWPDFSKRMTEFARSTRELAVVAKEKGKDAALEKMVDAFSCKQCHEIYREEKKK